MTMTADNVTESEIMAALRHELLRLAVEQDMIADQEAAQVPYWAPRPASVEGHRAAAVALRADADRFTIS